MHRGTAPNHIHIFIRLINSDSGTFCRHGTFTPSLDKISAKTDLCTPKSAATHAFSIRTDSRFSNRDFPFFLSNFSSGTSRVILESSHSPAPAAWVTDSPWDEPTSSTTTIISSVLTDKIFFSFNLKHVAIRLSSYYTAYLHTLYYTLIFYILTNFIKNQQNHQHNISRIRWGMELKTSSFQLFHSLSCSDTSILYITRNVT